MSRLPLIIGFGGINPAGRSSAHHAYRRLVMDHLPEAEAMETRCSLASLMGLIRYQNGQWLDPAGHTVHRDSYLKGLDPVLKNGTLIRQLENNLFDPARIPAHQRATLRPGQDQPLSFLIRRRDLPTEIPLGWQVAEAHDGLLRVEIPEGLPVMLETHRGSPVNSAGQLPSGFDPRPLYQSRNHPRGLQMTVFGASDALQSLGLPWEEILQKVAPDQVSVYAGSSMSQLDYEGNGGLLQARLLGKRVTSKQLALGFAEMPADFINAYLLGNMGTTGTNVAACATFLYNLRQAMRDIRSGSHRIAIVGTSEAPITPEVIEGYATMGALADDRKLLDLDAALGLETPDYRRACRPFGLNTGFTLGESAQFFVLCDDALALELGATIHGAVNDVFVNADGHKKSISSPGIGNYITMAKAAAATEAVIGAEGLQQRSFVQAHGTGTPQNRTTESHIIDEVARARGIPKWPVSAIKAFVGHSLASASADQLMATLGVWRYGILPGIETVDRIADDVHQNHAEFLLQHREVGAQGTEAAILNAKGFGGNNASTSILAPHVVHRMLRKRHGEQAMAAYEHRNEAVREAAADHDTQASRGQTLPVYRFGEGVLDGSDIDMDRHSIRVRGQQQAIHLPEDSPYGDML
ncbi:MAG: beta-ketoacyl synthase [Pseudohongiellaceae bacterium]